MHSRMSVGSGCTSKAPEAMQLRYLTTLTTIANDKQSTIVFPFPIELMRIFSGPGKGSP